jgi:hypothetical protein
MKTGDKRNVPHFFYEWKLVNVPSGPKFPLLDNWSQTIPQYRAIPWSNCFAISRQA